MIIIFIIHKLMRLDTLNKKLPYSLFENSTGK